MAKYSVTDYSILFFRSWTVDILYNYMFATLSQWWYSEYFALHDDINVGYLPSIPAQGYYWIS